MASDAIHYEVYDTSVGTVYSGTDESLADAAYDRRREYIDNDACFEPIRVVYAIDGVKYTTHETITWKQNYPDL